MYLVVREENLRGLGIEDAIEDAIIAVSDSGVIMKDRHGWTSKEEGGVRVSLPVGGISWKNVEVLSHLPEGEISTVE